jgi:hypothetical protein
MLVGCRAFSWEWFVKIIMKLPHIDKQPRTDVRTLFGISKMTAIFAKTRQNFKLPGFQ